MVPSDSDCEKIGHKNSLKISFVPFNIFELMMSVPEEKDNERVSAILAMSADVIRIGSISRQARGRTQLAHCWCPQ